MHRAKGDGIGGDCQLAPFFLRPLNLFSNLDCFSLAMAQECGEISKGRRLRLDGQLSFSFSATSTFPE